MAVNLFQAADASLVTAATRAGLASAPPDYSDTFESVLSSYEKTMKANSDMWKSIMEAGVSIATHIKKGVDGPQKSQEIEDLLGTTAGSAIKTELTEIRDGIAKTYYPANLLEAGNRENREAFQKRRNDLIAGLEHISSSSLVTTSLLEQDMVDVKKTSVYDLEKGAALLATKNGTHSSLGNSFVIDRDENGDWGYIMHHDPSKISPDAAQIEGYPYFAEGVEGKAGPIMRNGAPVRFTADEITKGLILKDDGLKLKKNMEKIYGGHAKAGADGKPMDYIQLNKAEEQVNSIAENPAAWKTGHIYAEGGMSWMEQINNVSVASASSYGQLGTLVSQLNTLEEEEKADLLSGVMDIGEPGITTEDFHGTTYQHEKNYKALTLALFNPGDSNYDVKTTGKIFKQHTTGEIDKIRAFSWSKNPKNPQGTNYTSPIPITTPVDNFPTLTNSATLPLGPLKHTQNKGTLEQIRTYLETGVGFPLGHRQNVIPKNGGWEITIKDKHGEIEGKPKYFKNTETLVREGLYTNLPGFQNLKQYNFVTPSYEVPGAFNPNVFDPNDY